MEMGAIFTNIAEIFAKSGWAQIFFTEGGWKYAVMLAVACVLLYLAIVKQFEPLLLLPIGFGMLMTNLPLDGIFHMDIFINETNHINWELLGSSGGMVDYIYLGVKLGIYPPLIFLGIGTMTDFEPLIARPSSLLLGAAAQLGIFFTFVGAKILGFTNQEAGAIGIIGGADGPTAIYVTTKLAPHLLGSIAVAAYCYMALVPVIQPPIMKVLTTEKERQIVMTAPRRVSKTEKILFPIIVTIIVALTLPDAAILVGCLMMGNLMKESGVVERITKTAGNELMNIITIFLGFSVGCTTNAATFLNIQTVEIIVLGIVAFGVGTAGGVILGKVMCAVTHGKINPLIGSAGVSAVPMAARVSQKVGQEYNPRNYLLMHAMGPNVAGVIGSAVAAGILINMFG
jgi:sodium ion-translocating decarboxylase beta subunit